MGEQFFSDLVKCVGILLCLRFARYEGLRAVLQSPNR